MTSLQTSLIGGISILWCIVGIICASTFRFLYLGFYYRRLTLQAEKDGLVLLPGWSPWWGHLKEFGQIFAKFPKTVHAQVVIDRIAKDYPDLPLVWGLDLWPFGYPMIIVTSPEVAKQISQDISLPKHGQLQNYIKPMIEAGNILTSNGEQWKFWRGVFNPGFSKAHLTTLVPGMVQDTLTFCELLRKHSRSSELVQMQALLTNLTIDIIGKVVMDYPMQAQETDNPFVKSFRAILLSLLDAYITAPLDKFNPRRQFTLWYHRKRMDNYIGSRLEERFATRRAVRPSHAAKRHKPVIDLALDTYIAEKQQHVLSASSMPSKNPTSYNITSLDPAFKKAAVENIKLLMFAAGHDTTSSVMCSIYYLLWKNPATLANLLAEHDRVLGSDVSQTALLISEDQSLLSQLPYTLACVKEGMRLYPPASTIRTGLSPADIMTLHHENGNVTARVAVQGMMTWNVHYAMHRNPAFWPRAEEFLPERWLVPESDPLHPNTKGAYRPFEFGPRNCIGQELALLEMKLILAMTVRQFRIEVDYEGWEKMLEEKGLAKKGVRTVNGERMYQIQEGTAKPSEDWTITDNPRCTKMKDRPIAQRALAYIRETWPGKQHTYSAPFAFVHVPFGLTVQTLMFYIRGFGIINDRFQATGAKLAIDLISKGVCTAKEIMVIVFFGSQFNALWDLFEKLNQMPEFAKLNLRDTTIVMAEDCFGAEEEIVMVDTVVSHKLPDNMNIEGDLKLMHKALSRARNGLFMVGDMHAVKHLSPTTGVLSNDDRAKASNKRAPRGRTLEAIVEWSRMNDAVIVTEEDLNTEDLLKSANC
ncbi:hypothetical protein MMC25_002171 [Agyrium rufum]|nr:hypothetical protein [Agyrium rufum]